jgi:hypothetical protein
MAALPAAFAQRPRRVPPVRVPAEKAAAPAGRVLAPGVVVL